MIYIMNAIVMTEIQTWIWKYVHYLKIIVLAFQDNQNFERLKYAFNEQNMIFGWSLAHINYDKFHYLRTHECVAKAFCKPYAGLIFCC